LARAEELEDVGDVVAEVPVTVLPPPVDEVDEPEPVLVLPPLGEGVAEGVITVPAGLRVSSRV
jgi:hypothetical protein